MRYRWWAFTMLLVLCWMISVPAIFAQSGDVIVDDNRVGIDTARIRTAATALANQGARVVVVTTESGTESYLDQRLAELGIAQSSDPDDLPADVIIYFVSMDDRISGIYYGRNFVGALDSEARNIRENYLNAGLRAGDPTRGLVDALGQTATAVGSPVTIRTEATDDGGGSGILLFVGLVVVGALALFVLPALLRRRGEGKAVTNQLQDAQQRYAAARQAAGGAIADLGQQMRDATEKQRFDTVSYPATQTQELAKRHQAVQASFHDLQVKFDDIEERMSALTEPRVLDYESAIGVYEEVRQQALALRSELNAMDSLRKELDQLSAQAPGEVERLKKS